MEQPHTTCHYHLRATQQAELNGQRFTAYNFSDPNWYSPSPTCLRSSESQYRKGYLHGYSQAMDDIKRVKKRGYARIEEAWNILASFFDGALSRWTWSDCDEIAFPPEMPKPPSWSAVRSLILRRDGQCVECGSTEELEVDHIRSVKQGGMPIEGNLRVLCVVCHRSRRKNDAF